MTHQSYIPANLVATIAILLCVREWEWVDRIWSNVLLPNDPVPVVIFYLVQDPRKTFDIIKGLEMMLGVVYAVHPVLMLREIYNLYV